MNWTTEYWGMKIWAESPVEQIFLKTWHDGMAAFIDPPDPKQGGYDGNEEYGMVYVEPGEDYKHGAVLFIR